MDQMDDAPWSKADVAMNHRSLFIFSSTNPIRRASHGISRSKPFEYGILAVIILSSVALAVESPGLDPDGDLKKTLDAMDLYFTAVFTAELVLKVVAQGFCMHPGSYLRSGWNVLDCVIVVTSVVGLLANKSSKEMHVFRTFRMFRALRPLRMISRMRGLQVVVTALLRSMPAVLNVVGFGVFEFGVFGILGVQLFGGKFWRCNDAVVGGASVMDQAMCTPGQFVCTPEEGDLCGATQVGQLIERSWDNPAVNFDNLGNAVVSLFVIVTLDDWMRISYHCMDAVDVGMQPVLNQQPYMVMYCIAFVFFGSLFWINLLVGVVIDHYTIVMTEMGEANTMTEDEKRWNDVFKMKKMEREEKIRTAVPTNAVRKKCFHMINTDAFNNFVMGCIVVNVLSMSVHHHDESPTVNQVLNISNKLFTLIFIAEAVVKLVALYPSRYFTDNWNKFDFVIACVSVPDFFLNVGASATVFRIFRIGRVFKLVQRWSGLRMLFSTLVNSIPGMVNVGSLLFLLMFVYGVLGMNLFGEMASDGAFLNSHANFRTFGESLLVLFRVFTNDGWSGILYDAMGCDESGYRCGTSPIPALYFISFQVIGSFVMLNLIIAVILDKFLESATEEGMMSSSKFLDVMKRTIVLNNFVLALQGKLAKARAEGKLPSQEDVSLRGGSRGSGGGEGMFFLKPPSVVGGKSLRGGMDASRSALGSMSSFSLSLKVSLSRTFSSSVHGRNSTGSGGRNSTSSVRSGASSGASGGGGRGGGSGND